MKALGYSGTLTPVYVNCKLKINDPPPPKSNTTLKHASLILLPMDTNLLQAIVSDRLCQWAWLDLFSYPTIGIGQVGTQDTSQEGVHRCTATNTRPMYVLNMHAIKAKCVSVSLELTQITMFATRS